MGMHHARERSEGGILMGLGGERFKVAWDRSIGRNAVKGGSNFCDLGIRNHPSGDSIAVLSERPFHLPDIDGSRKTKVRV